MTDANTDLARFDALKADVSLFVAPVKTLKVSDFKTAADAIDVGKKIKTFLKQIEDQRKAIVGPLNGRVDFVNAYCKDFTVPIKAAATHVQNEINAFAELQEKIKQENLRRAEEDRRAQDRKAEEERQKIAAEQEAKKQAELKEIEQAQAAADEMFGEAVDAEQTSIQMRAEIEERNERERLEREALLDRERAIREQQARDTTYDINQGQIKNARNNWEVEVVDINLVPKEFLTIELNESFALAAIRADKNRIIPGLKFVQKINVSLGRNTYVPRKALEG